MSASSSIFDCTAFPSKDNAIGKINLLKLLSACVDSCSRGCQVIRFVHDKRCRRTVDNVFTNDSKSNETKVIPDNALLNGGVRYKEANDPRSALTEADGASQKVIVDCLKSIWGDGLNIIGEEDDIGDKEEAHTSEDAYYSVHQIRMDVFDMYNVRRPSDTPLYTDLLSDKAASIVEEDGMTDVTNVLLEEVTVYIDPLDGTREFVENRLKNVQCLVGIALRGNPVAGVIGIPFGDDNRLDIVYGISSGNLSILDKMSMDPLNVSLSVENYALNTFMSDPNNVKSVERENFQNVALLRIFTGDNLNRIHITHALEYLDTWTTSVTDCTKPSVTMDWIITGGCGNKFLRTITDDADDALCIIPPGTCSWDTAAPSAILYATLKKYNMKGKVTDSFGGELIYKQNKMTMENDLGVIVSRGDSAITYHEKLCQVMKKDRRILDSIRNKY